MYDFKTQVPAQQQKPTQQKQQQAKFTIDDIKQIMSLFGSNQAGQSVDVSSSNSNDVVAGYTPDYYLPGGPGMFHSNVNYMHPTSGKMIAYTVPTEKYKWGDNIHSGEWQGTISVPRSLLPASARWWDSYE